MSAPKGSLDWGRHQHNRLAFWDCCSFQYWLVFLSERRMRQLIAVKCSSKPFSASCLEPAWHTRPGKASRPLPQLRRSLTTNHPKSAARLSKLDTASELETVPVNFYLEASQPLPLENSENKSQAIAKMTTNAGITAPDGPIICKPPAINIVYTI